MKATIDDRLLPSGNEAGTAPGDRKFRPDVQGLRAVAILLVVLFHAGVPGLTGGYVGVDVFFVISGFVITGVLLRERSSTGTNSLLAFYGRRARRIIPAATLVIIVTVLAAHWYLDSLSANQTAADGQWHPCFWRLLHFAASGTNYPGFASTTFPSAKLLVARGRGAIQHRLPHHFLDYGDCSYSPIAPVPTRNRALVSGWWLRTHSRSF